MRKPTPQLDIALLAFLLASALAPSMDAQFRGFLQLPVRVGETNDFVTVIGPELRWRTSGAELGTTLPFERVLCGTPVGSDVVVAGRDADGRTILVRVSAAAGAAEIVARRESDLDIRAVVHDAKNCQIFTVATSGEILAGPDASIPAESEWELVGSSKTGRAWAHEEGGMAIGSHSNYVRITRAADGAWVTTRHVVEGKPLVWFWQPPTTTGPLQVQLGFAGPLSLEDRDGKRISLGAGQRGVASYALPEGTTLDPRREYRLTQVVDGEAVPSEWRSPVVRLGRASSRATDLEIRSFGTVGTSECYAGSAMFVVVGRVEVPTTPAKLRVYGWSHVVEGSGPPPVTRGALDSTYLAPSAGMGLGLPIANSGLAMYVVSFPIPDDPALAGAVLYFQTCVVDEATGGAALSEVLGVAIRSRPRSEQAGHPEALARYLEKHAASQAEIEKILNGFHPR